MRQRGWSTPWVEPRLENRKLTRAGPNTTLLRVPTVALATGTRVVTGPSFQKQAQEERKLLENAKAQANMQPQVVESERGVEISKNLANAEIEKSTGDARAIEIRAEGSAKATKLKAGADAEATRVTATADAEAIEKKGLAQALVILEQGKSNAESYKQQVAAMGSEVFGQIQVVDRIAANKLKLIPDVYVGGAASGQNGEQSGLMSLALLQYLTGKNVLASEATNGHTRP